MENVDGRIFVALLLSVVLTLQLPCAAAQRGCCRIHCMLPDPAGEGTHPSCRLTHPAKQTNEFKSLVEEATSELILCDNEVALITKSFQEALQ